MPTKPVEIDYLIVGAGAMGMAFADVLLNEMPNVRLAIVDRRARPGGHWNNAYPYVALHQPSAFYGVNSAKLGSGGGADLASGAEILAYYERVMDRFLASGRVTFLPMCDYRADGRIVSVVNSDSSVKVNVTGKVVDATFMNVKVPSVTEPSYAIEPGVALVPPNDLPGIREPWADYTVIGAGKTAIDAVLFLLDQGVDAEKIQWIVPHDAWLFDRASLQPGLAMQSFVLQMQCIAEAGSVDQLFLELEKQGVMCRIDKSRLPEKWRCAAVSQPELVKLRKIKQVVRKGRVQRLGPNEITLDKGSIPTTEKTLHIDCTADGLARLEPQPIFTPGRITLQSAFMCQQVFSAAIIGYMERLKLSDEVRNKLCQPVPHPEYKQDYVTCLIASFQNLLNLNPHMPLWLRRSRLYVMHHEPLYRYLLGSLRIQRGMPAALASMKAMLANTAG